MSLQRALFVGLFGLLPLSIPCSLEAAD